MAITAITINLGHDHVHSSTGDEGEVVAIAAIYRLPQESQRAVAAGLLRQLQLHPAHSAIRIAPPVAAVVPNVCQREVLVPELQPDASDMVHSLRPGAPQALSCIHSLHVVAGQFADASPARPPTHAGVSHSLTEVLPHRVSQSLCKCSL